jgi:hypothetical protein
VVVALAAVLSVVGGAGASLPVGEASAAEAGSGDAAPHPGGTACERGNIPPAGDRRGRGLTCPPDETDPVTGDPGEASGGAGGGAEEDEVDGQPDAGGGGSSPVVGDGSAGGGPSDGSAGGGRSNPVRGTPVVPTPAGRDGGAGDTATRGAETLRPTGTPRGVPAIPDGDDAGPDVAPAADAEVGGSSDRVAAGEAGDDLPTSRPGARPATDRGPDVASAATGPRIAGRGQVADVVRAADIGRDPAVRDERHAVAQVGRAVPPPGQGSVTLRVLATGLFLVVLVLVLASVPRPRRRPTGPVGRAVPVAPAVPVGPMAPADPIEPDVPAPPLWAGVASVEVRRVRRAEAARLAAREVATEARIAGSCLPAVPTATAVALVALGGVSTVTALDVLALAAAAVLTVLGVRWTWRLPTTTSRALARVERRLDDEQHYLDRLGDALVLAKRHAVAGLDGAAALGAAVGGDADHPLQRLRGAPVSGVPARSRGDVVVLGTSLRAAEGTSGETAVGALARCEPRLHQHQQDVHRRRLQLVRVRALGPFLACALPATALVAVALSS